MQSIIIHSTDGSPENTKVALADGTPIPGVSSVSIRIAGGESGAQANLEFDTVSFIVRADADLSGFDRSVTAVASKLPDEQRHALVASLIGAKGMTHGLDLIAEERTRQIMVKLCTSDMDDSQKQGQLAGAAAVYALAACGFVDPLSIEAMRKDVTHKVTLWPWADSLFKPDFDPIDNLKKAGALITAEIDRLLRKRENEDLPL